MEQLLGSLVRALTSDNCLCFYIYLYLAHRVKRELKKEKNMM